MNTYVAHTVEIADVMAHAIPMAVRISRRSSILIVEIVVRPISLYPIMNVPRNIKPLQYVVCPVYRQSCLIHELSSKDWPKFDHSHAMKALPIVNEAAIDV